MVNKLVVAACCLAALCMACSEGYPLLRGSGSDPDSAVADLDCFADGSCDTSFVDDSDPATGWDAAGASCESLVGTTLIDGLDAGAPWAAELGDDVFVGDAALDLQIPVAKNMDEPYNWPAKWGAWTRIVVREPKALHLQFQDDETSARFMLLDRCALYPVDDDVLARGPGGIETGVLPPNVYYLAAFADRADELFVTTHFVESESCDSLPVLTMDDLAESYEVTLQGQAGDFFVNEHDDSHAADVALSIDLTDSGILFPATVEFTLDSSSFDFPYSLAMLSECETETELVRDEELFVSEPQTEFVPAGGMYAGEYFTQVVLTAEIETAGVYQLVIKSDNPGRYVWGRIYLSGRVL